MKIEHKKIKQNDLTNQNNFAFLKFALLNNFAL